MNRGLLFAVSGIPYFIISRGGEEKGAFLNASVKELERSYLLIDRIFAFVS